jgi:hypothetical protein
MPVPPSTVYEVDGIDVTLGLPKSITHYGVLDEADLGLCRLEFVIDNPVILTQDSDLLSIVSCPIIRWMRGGKLEVTKGRRSAYEIVRAQLVGQDYVGGKGLSNCGPAGAVTRLSAVPHSRDAAAPLELFDQLNIPAGEERDRLVRAIEIWWNRSHGSNGVSPNTDPVYTAHQLRRLAEESQVANVGLVFQNPPIPSIVPLPARSAVKTMTQEREWYCEYHKTDDYDGDGEALRKMVLVSMQRRRKEVRAQKKKVSRQRGHEMHRLPPKRLIPFEQEVPQRVIIVNADANVVETIQGQEEETEEDWDDEGSEESVNVIEQTTDAYGRGIVGGPLPDTTTRLAEKDGTRTKMDKIFPRKTHKDTMAKLIKRFKLFSQKSHPFISLMQARVLASRTATMLLSKALKIYFREVFCDSRNHHLIGKFSSTHGMKDIFRGLAYLFTPPTRGGEGLHPDLNKETLFMNGRILEEKERKEWAVKSKNIDWAMICTRRELEKEGDLVEFPKNTLLITNHIIDTLVANLELKIRSLLEMRIRKKVDLEFPAVGKEGKAVLIEILLTHGFGQSITVELPAGAMRLTLEQLLSTRDYHLSQAGADSVIINRGCLPMAFLLHAFTQGSAPTDDGIHLDLDPTYWTLSSTQELQKMLRDGAKDMTLLQKYNYQNVWRKVKHLPERYLTRQHLEAYGNWLDTQGARDIRWCPDSNWVVKWNSFRLQVLLTAGSLYGIESTDAKVLHRTFLGEATTVPPSFLLESLIEGSRLPRGCIPACVISSDGYVLCIGMHRVDRGHITQASTEVGATKVVDVVAAEGKYTKLLGINSLSDTITRRSISGTQKAQRGIPLLPAERKAVNAFEQHQSHLMEAHLKMLNLPSMERLGDKTFIRDEGFHNEEKTRGGNCSWVQEAEDINWEDIDDEEYIQSITGIDSGVVRENKIVQAERQEDLDWYDISELEFHSRVTRADRRRRAEASRRLRSRFPLRLDLLKKEQPAGIYEAAELLYETWQPKRKHEFEVDMEKKTNQEKDLHQVGVS